MKAKHLCKKSKRYMNNSCDQVSKEINQEESWVNKELKFKMKDRCDKLGNWITIRFKKLIINLSIKCNSRQIKLNNLNLLNMQKEHFNQIAAKVLKILRMFKMLISLLWPKSIPKWFPIRFCWHQNNSIQMKSKMWKIS